MAGTLVATANDLSAIETIKAGDYVLSTDPDTMQTTCKPVLETYIRKVDRLVHPIISGEKIITTVDHSFYNFKVRLLTVSFYVNCIFVS